MNGRLLEKTIIFLIALHSFILGAAMLFQPARTLELFNWNYQGSMFFPAQSGIFLLLAAGVYLAAIWHRRLIWFITASKCSAVLFLITEYFIIGPDAPATILAAALFDGFMGAAVIAIYIWQTRQNKTTKSVPPP